MNGQNAQFQIEPLSEIRALIVINQKLVGDIEQSQRGNAIDIDLALQRIGTIDTALAVILNRIDRIDKDADEAKTERQATKQQSTQQVWIVWGALLSAILAVVAPLVIRPASMTNSSQTMGK